MEVNGRTVVAHELAAVGLKVGLVAPVATVLRAIVHLGKKHGVAVGTGVKVVGVGFTLAVVHHFIHHVNVNAVPIGAVVFAM